MLAADELYVLMRAGAIFSGFIEPQVTFPPTYKRFKGAKGECGDYTVASEVVRGFSNIYDDDDEGGPEDGSGGHEGLGLGLGGSHRDSGRSERPRSSVLSVAGMGMGMGVGVGEQERLGSNRIGLGGENRGRGSSASVIR